MQINKINGWVVITDIINNYLVTRKYMYYSKRKSISLFKKEMKVKSDNGM